MSDLADDARTFLRAALEKTGWAPGRLAKAAGVSPTTITRPLNDPEFKFTPKPATLLKIAEAAGIDLPGALSVAPRLPTRVSELPVLEPIQAGAFLLLDDTAQNEPEMLQAALDPRYPHAQQWLRPIQGDSMNALGINPGDTAHLVDFADSGAELRSGMIVEVQRFRAGMREITLKEVEIQPGGGVLLWPRSLNPRWKDAVKLQSDDGSEVEVRVTGLLVATFRRWGG